MIDFSQQTSEFAERYRDFVEAKIPVDLSDLARYTAAREEPIDQLDGSLESLDVLAAMMMRWIDQGLTGIPLGLPLSPDGPVTESGDSEMALWSRARFLVPWVFAYVLVTARQRDPGARLSIYAETRGRRVVDINLNTTGIELSDGTWFPPHFIMNVLYGYARGTDLDETRLRGLLLDQAPGLGTMPRLEKRMQLNDYLLRPPVSVNDSRRIPPSPVRSASAANTPVQPERPELLESSYVVARGSSAGLANPSRFHEIVLSDVEEWFDSIGATTAGLADALAAGSDEFETSMGELVVMQLALADRSVRAIFVERIEASDSEWVDFCASAQRFATSIGARFGTEDEWPD